MAAGYITSTIDGSFWTASLAADASDNLYFSNPFPTAGGGSGTNGLFKETFNNGTYAQSTIITSTVIEGVAVDGNGNVYGYDYSNGTLLKETLSAGTYTESTLSFPMLGRGLVLDAQGNIYAPGTQTTISKLDVSDAPSLSFATTAAGSTSSDSPQTVTVLNNGNAILNFPVPSDGTNPSIGANFILDSSTGSACPLANAGGSTAGTLDAGASCELSISFEPAFGGPLAGSLVLTDSASNRTTPNYATQTISLSGSGIHGPAEIAWPTPSAIAFGTALSSVQLNATANLAGTFNYSPAVGTVLGAGTQTLKVYFSPSDTVDYESATATVSLLVNKATPANSLTSPASNAFVSNSVVFTAALTSQAGTATGTVSFYDGTTLLGTQTLSNGVATYTTSALTAGNHPITAAYSGDTNFAAVTSAAFTEVIEDFTLAEQGSGSATATPGGQAVYTLLVSPPSGASVPRPINLSVGGLPSGATAKFSPSTVLPGSGATNVTFTVTLPNSAATQSLQSPFVSGALPTALGLMLLPFITEWRKYSSHFGRMACLALLAILSIVLVGVSGCSGSGGNGGKTGTGSTPQPQNYSLTVTATSGSLSHTASLNLTVN